MAVATQDGLVAAMASAIPYSYQRSSIANMVAGNLCSMWRANGSPLQGAIPSTAATCNSSLTGCVPYNNPGSPNLTYLGQFTLQNSLACAAILFDRLAHMGGLSGTVTTAQTVSVSTPASRGVLSDFSNVEWYLEWYTDTGSTAVTATVTYTNQGSTSGKTTTVAMAATVRTGTLLRITPAAGDTIQSIQSVTLSATTGTVGSFGVTCCIRLAEVPLSNPYLVTTLDAFNLGLPRIYDNSCLVWAVLCSTTSTGIIQGRIRLAQG